MKTLAILLTMIFLTGCLGKVGTIYPDGHIAKVLCIKQKQAMPEGMCK